MKLGGAAVALLAEGTLTQRASAGGKGRKARPGNILLIYTDQQHIDTIAAGGCPHVRTPALDRIKRSGVSFMHSYSANPV
ncbi:MAG: hypothetical protein JSW47_06660, partial [Phycisphaerales bacterium]